MIYEKFNEYIKKKFFLPERKGNTILFSVDEVTISEFLELENIESQNFKKSLAETLCKYWPKTSENYFGICAIQVFIVYQMQEEEEFSCNQYNPRLAKFLEIDTNDLQKLYSESQDTIWKNLKRFCDDNDFQLNIPSSTTGKGCYIQYPFSQSLMNKEDLNKVSILFERSGIKQSEYISFDDFSQLIKNADNGYCMNTHYYKIKDRLLNDFGNTLQLYQQIYNYFNESWDGSYHHREEQETDFNKSLINTHDVHLFLNKTLDYITVLDDEYEIADKILLSDKNIYSQIEKYQYAYSDEILIFKFDVISEEAEYVRSFELGCSYVIICQKFSNASTFIHSLCDIEIKQNSIYDIFITKTLNKRVKHHFWNKYFSSQSRNYKIEGGVKLAYKTWMIGCGPKIIFDEKSVAWINGKKFEETEIDCTNLPGGIYKIVKDSSVEKFEIKVPLYLKNYACNGWNVDKQKNNWNPTDKYFHISGLFNNFSKETKTSTIRDWIKLLTTKNNDTEYSSSVLKTIKRANYGV